MDNDMTQLLSNGDCALNEDSASDESIRMMTQDRRYTEDSPNRSYKVLNNCCSYTSVCGIKDILYSKNPKLFTINALSILTAVSAISFAAVTYRRLVCLESMFESRAEEALRQQTMCIPCSDLKQGPYKEDNEEILVLSERHENSRDVCCAENANQTSLVLELLFRRKIREYLAKGILSNGTRGSTSYNRTLGTVSAHLFIGLHNDKKETGVNYVRHWSLDDPVAHMRGVRFGNLGRLVVEESGLYFIYSQIRYDLYHERQRDLQNSLHHYILRYNPIYPNDGQQILLKSASTLCWAEDKVYEDRVTYVGAAIYLNYYDELFVEASNLSLVSRDSKASYFGLFKAG